jgi:hypothetical protein
LSLPLTKPKVFVCNKSSHDFRPALKFGELVFVTKGEVNKFALTEIYRQFHEAMKDSTDDDFFLPTSLPILCAIGTGILAHRHGRVRFLLYRSDAYIIRTVDFTNAD